MSAETNYTLLEKKVLFELDVGFNYLDSFEANSVCHGLKT